MAYQPLQLHPYGGHISKQRIVFKVPIGDAKKRRKALKSVVGFPGVLAATLQGDDRVLVEGEGLDAVKLNKKLKKELGSAELVSFTNGHNKLGQMQLPDGKIIDTTAATPVGPYPFVPVHPQPTPYYAYRNPPPLQYYYEPQYDSEHVCAIM